MGLWDFITSLFGGGAKMALELDASEVPVGGILSGRAILTGAPKPYPVTAVKVQLLYVHTQAKEDSPIPEIDVRVMLDNTIANNDSLGANEEKAYSFTFQIPNGTEPSAHNVSYTVQVLADIPGIRDPTAKKDLKVREADENAGTTSLDAIYERWPALRGTQEDPLVDALRDMRWAHSDYDETKDLLIAEPIVARFMREGSPRVKRAALETWASILGDRARKENLKTLEAILKSPDADEDLIVAGLDAAAKFASAGGIKLLEPFATHTSDKVREQVADSLQYQGGENKDKRRLLESMLNDSMPHVRAKAIKGLDDFTEDKALVHKIAGIGRAETAAEPQEAVLSAMRSAFYNGSPDVALEVFDLLSQSPHANVREEAANSIQFAFGYVDGSAVVLRLLADANEGVREKMAYEVQNFGEEHAPKFKDPLKNLADNDPVDKVRTAAINALQKAMTKEEVVAYYRHLMATEPTEAVLRGVVHGCKFEMDPEYKAILKDLGTCDFPRVAKEARDGFEFSYD
ncbi:MAG: HEAT repeat domain-containing protein [Alphaproteobacteria bacterium]|nr:HEAT repeat domain-containing protein [Alphaproteobacteria bacterium]MCB9791164.1 HEAT repeat domain-containing protein [Alphaproteobacteria bacterium]